MIENAPHMTATLQDLVAATGVSERTPRAAFHKFFGVSLQNYRQLRRLQQARSLLRVGRIGDVIASGVIARLSLWDLGRFAGKYRRSFGELPSATLRRGSNSRD